jgi:methylglutaconyl-CoA hydratase
MENIVISFPKPAIATLTLNRPEKRNALNARLLQELQSALSSLKNDPNCTVLILQGAGPKFCSGLDLDEASDFSTIQSISDVLEDLYDFPKATIASVHGAAFAGGAGLMAACDLAIISESTLICFPEVRRGLVPAFVMPLLLKKLKQAWVNELVLLAEPLTAEHALQIGLANCTAPETKLYESSIAMAEKILLGGPESISQTKSLMRKLDPIPLKDQLHIAHSFHEKARQSSEAQEGLKAFFQKRPPNWTIH